MNQKIIVVTHKDYQMPDDDLYFPICVGTGLKSLSHKFQPDNEGENISDKNSTYCELTAIYWAWKNLNADWMGVAHYRRHFSLTKGAATLDMALSEEQLNNLCAEYGTDTIFTTPSKHYMESIEGHYIHSLKGYEKIHMKDIERLKKAIHECNPDYDDAAAKVLGGSNAHMLNMFIMSKSNFDAYCSWLFPIIDRAVSMSADREDQRRYAGALSEFCLDIWAQKNKIKIKELPILETEKPSTISRIKRYIARKL
ncbi:DUF4422 domain-containing protein [Butyrivibrio sp. NC2007]|uniref:DUF4422 domain-containing protein n=1 Tax=Butyrivibrio sp. NC2007 TaxID=1280683 RepID=UPI0003B3B3AA|nr:DUF4422 domain-containing protein [Butyrivibrio sp. NC2007]